MEKYNVNFGCGKAPISGWINYDNSFSIVIARVPILRGIARPIVGSLQRQFIDVCDHNDIRYLNMADNIPLGDGEVENIYALFSLDYLEEDELMHFLSECRRIKTPNGWIRVGLPSIEMYIAKYFESKDPAIFRNLRDFSPPKLSSFFDRLRFLLLGTRNQVALYNEMTLSEVLRSAGFKNIQIVESGKTNMRNYGKLNLSERASEAFYIECQ